MENKKRTLLAKRLEEAKQEAKRKQEAAEVLERALIEMDQVEAQKLLQKYHLTPGELEDILEEKKKENEELLKKMERGKKKNETIEKH